MPSEPRSPEPGSPAQMSPGYRHFVLGLSTLAAVGSSVVHMGTPFLIPALTATGLSLPAAGLIAAMPAAGIVVTLIAWGWFVDVFGERAALSLGLGSTAAMTGVAAWASESGAVALAGALFFAGCAAASVNSASGRVVSGWYPPSQRGTAMGIRQMAQPLGAALSAVTLPVLAATHGIGAALTGRAGVDAIRLLRKPAIDALEHSRRFEAPLPISEVAELAKPFLSIGNQYGEGWFLTGEMAELLTHGTPNIVCIQPFACLPNHVVGKGVIKTLKNAYPQANIVAVDYDPGASEVNQLNRIKLMLSAAKKAMEPEKAKPGEPVAL